MFSFQPKVNTEKTFDYRENQVYEAAKLFGRPMWYLRSNVIEDDKIFGEAISRDFLNENAYEFYGTRDNDTSFAGSETFGGFGFVPSYNSIIFIPVKYFKITHFDPIEGDLIYMEDKLFEITKVNTLTEAYEGDRINERLFNYKIYLKLYNLTDDNFDIPDIPNIEYLDSPDLNNLNDDLTSDIENEQPIIVADQNNPFGDLG